jgi:dolichol-phosphate mannosyltransferase
MPASRANLAPDGPSRGPLLSIVTPVHNEEDGIAEFYKRVVAALGQISPAADWELIFVDDGSTDGSASMIRKLCDEVSSVKLVTLSRNFGQQAALTAGIDHAEGRAVVVLDSDLQDPPELIPELVERWRAGFKVVYGVRRQRTGEGPFKRFTARAFYRLLDRISEVRVPVDAGDYRLMDRRVVEVLRDRLREQNRYFRGLVSWVGFSQCGVEFDRVQRFAGTTKWSLGKLVRLAFDAITSFSERPLRLSLQLGSVVTLGSLLYAMWIILGRLLTPERTVPGFATLIVAILFLGGVQLFSIGLLGEYVGRIYRETKDRPLYLVDETVNLERRTR